MSPTANAFSLAIVPDFRSTIIKRSVKDQVGDKIAALIASGILRVGDALPGERELASALNVSRETVRGAIQVLAGRGILEVSHGARTRVLRAQVGPVLIGVAQARAIDAYDLDAVHAARLCVEREVVSQTARRVTPDLLHALDLLLEAQSATTDDPVAFLISDREFHITIYQASGNALLADIAADLYAYMMERRRLVVAQPGAISRSLAEHRAIVAALRTGKPNAAIAAFEAHTERIRETTRSVLEVRAQTP